MREFGKNTIPYEKIRESLKESEKIRENTKNFNRIRKNPRE